MLKIGLPLIFGEADWLNSLPFDRITQAVLTLAGGAVLLGAAWCYTTRRYLPGVQQGWLRWLVYLGFAASVLVLAVTSLQAVLVGQPLAEYALMGHVAAAGGFTFLLVAIAWFFLPHVGLDNEFHSEHRWWLARWSSWLLVLASLFTAGTMFLSMLPILDTAGLHQVLAVHRLSGLATVSAILLHAFSLVMTRLGLR